MLSKEEISAFLAREFPQTKCVIESLGDGEALLSHPVGEEELRPGGTVSGPVMMGLADVALYVALFTRIGIVPLAVTTNLTTNFLRKPSGDRPILARCRMIKVGRTQAVGEVSLYSEGSPEKTVAHVVGTYAIPPRS